MRASTSEAEPVHVLVHPDEVITVVVVERARRGAAFLEVGATEHFAVACQQNLGYPGTTLARGVLAACERDYAAVRTWFGGIDPPGLPIRVWITRGQFGAFHADCAATDIHVAAFSGHNVDLVEMVTMAEVVEVFSAAQRRGWACGMSNGEGLSRVLATELYPAQLDGFTTADAWLASDRPDFVDANDPTDRNPVSIGCATLFLNYLHHQLGFNWTDIVTGARSTLGETHQALTDSASTGWTEFSELLAAHYPPGKDPRITTDNVFPL
jgi:hypothetical protein